MPRTCRRRQVALAKQHSQPRLQLFISHCDCRLLLRLLLGLWRVLLLLLRLMLLLLLARLGRLLHLLRLYRCGVHGGEQWRSTAGLPGGNEAGAQGVQGGLGAANDARAACPAPAASDVGPAVL